MTAIWRNDGTGWSLLAPAGFPDEEALHALVEQAPQILPLAGTPRLTVVGREVLLGGNYADLIAVEPSGRVVVVEIKLARNSEARRAVIAQVLTYAAYLRRLDPAALERDILGPHLRKREYENLSRAVATNDQDGSFDATAFAEGLVESLGQGRFRLVLVLDDAPDELVQLVGYLEAVADKLLIDLITVSAYEIEGSQVLIPQRIDADQPQVKSADERTPRASSEGRYVEGAADFVAGIEAAPEEQRPILHRLVEWAKELEREGLVTLGTYHGTSGRWTLLPRLRADKVGLVTIWNDRGASISVYRSVFERRAPNALPRVEELIAPARLGQGTSIKVFNDELFDALTAAYQEAARGRVSIVPKHSEDLEG